MPHSHATTPYSPSPGNPRSKTNESMKLFASRAGKQVLTWSSRVLRKTYLKEVRGLGKAGLGWAGGFPLLLPAARELEYRGTVCGAGRWDERPQWGPPCPLPTRGWMNVLASLAQVLKQVPTAEMQTVCWESAYPLWPLAASSSLKPSPKTQLKDWPSHDVSP